MLFIKKLLILVGFLLRVFHARMRRRKVIAFHVSVPLHFNYIKGILKKLSENKSYYVIVFCGFSNFKDFFYEPGIVFTESIFVLSRIKVDLIVTEDDWTNPCYKKSRIAHVMHSLASTHVIYPDGTFDGFNYIFCAGPHHKKELAAILGKKGIMNCDLIEAGYEVVDSLIKESANIKKENKSKRPCVLFAPSWGDNNALAKNGMQIVDTLINEYIVILRPHLLNIEMDSEIIEKIKDKHNDNDNFIFDENPDSIPSLMRADVMISDWSGVAFEYALSRLKPVVFIDVPMKEINKAWKQYIDVPGIECLYREKIGVILNDINEIKNNIESLLADRVKWAERIESQRSELVYNIGSCSEISYKSFDVILNK